MQYSVDIPTEIYVLEIICLQPFRRAIVGLKDEGVGVKLEWRSSGPEPPTDYLNIPTYPTGRRHEATSTKWEMTLSRAVAPER